MTDEEHLRTVIRQVLAEHPDWLQLPASEGIERAYQETVRRLRMKR